MIDLHSMCCSKFLTPTPLPTNTSVKIALSVLQTINHEIQKNLRFTMVIILLF